jgi:general secretion pathway protein A
LYNNYFHFSELPFSIAPDPHFMFMSARHQEGLAHLLYGINHGGGFVALTGEVGTGKTMLCHCLLQQLPENIDIALVLNPKMNAVELLATICDELRIPYDAAGQTLKNLVDALNRHLLNTHASGRRTVVMIDEAQNLSMEVLEQVRLLTNLETSRTKLLQIILVGQPELKELLARRELRQLNQRITARYHLQPLSQTETRAYVRHRLRVCGGDPQLFTDSAINKIFRVTQGIPRLVNIVCHCALLGAYSADKRSITPRIVSRAARETLAFAEPARSYLKPLTATLMLVSLLAAGNYFSNNPLQANLTEKSKMVFSGKLSAEIPVAGSANVSPPAQAVQPALVNRSSMQTQSGFADILGDPKLTLAAALSESLKLWGKTLTQTKTPLDCNAVAKAGLNCLMDRTRWQELVALNRPAILEFSVAGGGKRYVLLTGIKGGQPEFALEQNQTFPLADVLSLWEGYYLLVWRPPNAGMKTILPGQSSNYVLWLRQQLANIDSTHQDGNWSLYYDNALKKRVIAFQQSHHLIADGKVNAQTIIHLDNLNGAPGAPQLSQAN